MELKYNGAILPDEMITYLKETAEQLNVPVSYLIVKLHFEGIWGTSVVAKENNNWSGMSTEYFTGTQTRPSGVKVTLGGKRPMPETGYYYRYANIDDFLTDWTYLIRRGGIYKVADSSTFAEAVKGMFIYGGAKYDYATMDLPDGQSEKRYSLYLSGMQARRTAINNANGGALDTLDNQEKEVDTMQGTAQAMISEAQKMVGVTHGSSAYNQMVSEYNGSLAWAINNAGLSPKPRNVNLSSNPSSGAYDWCAAFISVMAKRAGAIGTVGFEIAAERLGKQQHQCTSTWLGRVKPKAGDLVLFRWSGGAGWADHIGLVESVIGDTINTIEGNVGSPRSVRRRSYKWNDYRITGYARPKYRTATNDSKKTITEIAQEVIAGKWGTGSARINNLANAGYSADAVQAKVNELLLALPELLKVNEEVAQEVIAGKWGNNPERSKKLIEAGYDVNAIQKLVNEILSQPEEAEQVEMVDEEPKDEVDITLDDNEFTIDGRVYVVKPK